MAARKHKKFGTFSQHCSLENRRKQGWKRGRKRRGRGKERTRERGERGNRKERKARKKKIIVRQLTRRNPTC